MLETDCRCSDLSVAIPPSLDPSVVSIIQQLIDELQVLREENSKLGDRCTRLENYEFLNRENRATLHSHLKSQKPASRKTEARIADLRKFLKKRGGKSSFKEVRRELSLKPNQLSALVAQLDKRQFLVLTNPRAKDERILQLRVGVRSVHLNAELCKEDR